MKFRLIIDSGSEEEIVAKVKGPSELTERIEQLVLEYSGVNTLAVYDREGTVQLDFSDIECVTVTDRKVFVIDKNGTRYRTNQRLCELEKLLPSYFIRLNKSAIANENRIRRFSTVYNGAVDAVFECGYREYVSRRCFAEIKRRLYSR